MSFSSSNSKPHAKKSANDEAAYYRQVRAAELSILRNFQMPPSPSPKRQPNRESAPAAPRPTKPKPQHQQSAVATTSRSSSHHHHHDMNHNNIYPYPPPYQQPARPTKRSHHDDAADADDPLNATQNLVHPAWETRDPTPDIQALFRAFDTRFFQQKLRCVSLEWSRRMYQCAGICYYRRQAGSAAITIRLSEPLLKLRQRKDLIETLLHEMIHAYLFVLNVREPNGGHGPNFKRLMVSINRTAGTNITVYHTFHDEVNVYRTHVWKCNGLCQHRAPFYGVVRRTCNRAPGPNDLWWSQHQSTCGGYFNKISEPEQKNKKKAPVKTTRVTIPGLDDANNVRSTGVQRIDDPKWGLAKAPPVAKAASSVRTISSSGGAAGTATSGTSSPGARVVAAAGGNLRNVIGFGDLAGEASGDRPPERAVSTGPGHKLGGSSGTGSNSIDLVRDVWSKKFSGNSNSATPQPTGYKVAPSTSQWQNVGDDDDVIVNDVRTELIEIQSDDDDDVDVKPLPPTLAAPARPSLAPADRQRAIKRELFGDDGPVAGNADSDDDDDIILIDDEFDDTLAASPAAAGTLDTSVIDDIFGTDTLLADFDSINGAMPDQTHGAQIITCPICTERMSRDDLPEHFNGCQGVRVAVEVRHRWPTTAAAAGGMVTMPVTPQAKRVRRSEDVPSTSRRVPVANTPRTAGDGVVVAGGTITIADDDESSGSSSTSEMVPCPSCWRHLPLSEINAHLDECLC